MINVDFVLVIIAVLVNLLIGLFTYYKNPNSTTNKLFFVYNIFLSLYLFVNYSSLHQETSQATHLWVNILMSVIAFLNFSFFLLVFTFPRVNMNIDRKGLILGFFFTILMIPAALSNLIFSSVVMTDSGTLSYPGPAMPAFIAHVVIFLGGGFYILAKKYLRSKNNERKQLFLFFVGTFVMYGAILITNFVAVLAFNYTGLVGLLPIYTIFFAGTVSYAIVKHKFLDINFLVLRTVSFTILIIITALSYSFLLFLIGNYLFNITITFNQQIFFIGITFLIAFSFPSLQRMVERLTNRIFFKDRYATDEEISKLSKIMTSTFNLNELTSKVMNEIQLCIKYTKANVIIFGKDGNIQFSKQDFSIADSDLKILQRKQELILFNSLEEGELKEILRNYDIQMSTPLVSNKEVIGILMFGQKNSGDSYTEQDLQFLSILSDSLAVAAENARSYEEIKLFNVRLQQEIGVATKELRDANNQLKDLDDLKDEFVSLASHELRTPMSAIKGSLSTILEGYAGDISNETREFLSAAYNENDRLIRLVNNLLNTSRIESGKLNFTLSDIDMTVLIQEVVKNMQIAVKEKNIFLRHESSGTVPIVTADEDKIKEVIINLIGNAIKFTSQGGITIKTEIVDGMLQTSIADTGTGIHKEDFDLLFKKFSQVKRDQKYTKSYGGTGLGLYLSQKIIEGLGGKIWLDSEVGKGTTFYFTLPIAK